VAIWLNHQSTTPTDLGLVRCSNSIPISLT
jgi:hypothetical protein